MSLSDHLIFKFLWAFGLLALLAVGLLACRSHPRVVISTKSGEQLALQVEVADTPAKRSLGLQYRNELGDDQGMLFLFPSQGAQSFWMKNTPLPLDMIFIGSDLKIVGIIRQAVPFSTTSLTVPAPSQFVLEIKGGLSRRKGIEVGNRVRFENISLEGIEG
ncbi:DUF192 domain-containing protein [bacterium]|nr:MAG: DUF192 domain-containing protein [bacterium]